MANCPNCGKEMAVTATVCPHCGYDFPLQDKPEPVRRGLAYGGMADAALVVGMITAILGFVLSLLGCVAALVSRQWAGAVSGLITSLVMLALYVVFVRVADLD